MDCEAEWNRIYRLEREIEAEWNRIYRLEREIDELRAVIVRAYQFVSPFSDPLPITNKQMAQELMDALLPDQQQSQPKT